jgi:hypothetical protein
LTPVFASDGRALPLLEAHPGYKKILHGLQGLHARIFLVATAPSWQKQRTRINPVAGNRALVLNFVFTRVVNHCVTVVGLQGPVARLNGGAESSESVTTES